MAGGVPVKSDLRKPSPTGGVPGRARRAPTAALLLTAFALFAVFAVLALFSGPDSALSGWDRRVSGAFAGWRTPGRTHLFWAMTLIGNDPVLAALSISVVALLTVWGRRAMAALFAVGMLGGWGVSSAAKAIVGRTRPPEADALIALPLSDSLPSGHSLATLVFLGLLVYMAWKLRDGAPGNGAAGNRSAVAILVTVICAPVAVLIGLSRVYLGVHWPSDVLGGWSLAGVCLVVLLTAFWRFVRRGAAGRGRAARLLSRRPPASAALRAAAVGAVLVLCVAVVILEGMADPLLADI